MSQLHESLRQARERKGWTLATLASRTGVRESVLAVIDRGGFGELPAGLYGRAALRAYAAEVGLDAVAVLDEAARLLPPVEDPLDGLARVRGFARRRRSESPRGPVEDARSPARPDTSAAATQCRHVAGAAAVDSMLLIAINGAVWALTSVVLGVRPAVAFDEAAPALCMLWTLIAGAYFVLLGGIRNGTPGVLLAGLPDAAHDTRTVTLRSSIIRGLRCAFEESSITVEWLIRSAHGQQWLRTLRQIRA
jgi:hypothetical protein